MVGGSRRGEEMWQVELASELPANCERMNVLVGGHRFVVTLDRSRPEPPPTLSVMLPEEVGLKIGEKVQVEFFHPGEQAGAH